jgi:hypothetical protein
MTDAPEGRDPGEAMRARHARLDALLAERLGPALPGLAEARRKTLLGWGGGLAAAVLLALLMLSGEAFELGAFGFVAILVTASGLHHYAGAYRSRVRDAVTPLVCEAIGGMKPDSGAAYEVLGRLRSLPIVAAFAHHTLDDVFAGRHDGTGFILAEIRLFNRSTRITGSGHNRRTTTRESTVFKGLLFLVETPEPIPTRILVRGPRIPWFADWRLPAATLGKLGFARVAVPDAAFSRHLALWAEDADAALRVIGPDLAATLARLAGTAGWRRIDAGFSGTRFILLLPKGGNSFAVGGLFRPLSRLREDAHRLLDEIMVVHRLVDVLKGKAG